MTMKRLAVFAVFLTFPSDAAMAQSYEIKSYVVVGGAGTSAGTGYELTGTVGEPSTGETSGGGYELRAGFWATTLKVVVASEESFQAWMDSFPPEDKPPEGMRGPSDAPAGDGMENLLKYAFGLNPMTPAAEAAPRLINEERKLGIELQRSKEAAVGFRLEGSTDMVSWSAVAFTEYVIDSDSGEGRERVRFVTDIVDDGTRHYFLRLLVSPK